MRIERISKNVNNPMNNEIETNQRLVTSLQKRTLGFLEYIIVIANGWRKRICEERLMRKERKTDQVNRYIDQVKKLLCESNLQ